MRPILMPHCPKCGAFQVHPNPGSEGFECLVCGHTWIENTDARCGDYMREIKYRGLTIDAEWVYGYLSILIKKHYEVEPGSYISNKYGSPFAYQIRPETTGQYINLKDKNGKEIYEGDTLKDEFGRVLLVEWWNGGFCFKAITDTNFIRAREIYQWFEGDYPRPEIISNIHENPEHIEATT